MKTSNKIMFKIVIIFVILTILFISIEQITLLLKKPKTKDEIILLEIENKFKVFKKFLSKHNIVGYITDHNFENDNKINYVQEFYLIQYTLSPVIIVQNSTYPLVIGNFHEAIDVNKIVKEKNLTILKDFNNGLFLFKSRRE